MGISLVDANRKQLKIFGKLLKDSFNSLETRRVLNSLICDKSLLLQYAHGA